jgi:L-asparaginase/Glu-tRNA(Gln) amidotransferase subunit D
VLRPTSYETCLHVIVVCSYLNIYIATGTQMSMPLVVGTQGTMASKNDKNETSGNVSFSVLIALEYISLHYLSFLWTHHGSFLAIPSLSIPLEILSHLKSTIRERDIQRLRDLALSSSNPSNPQSQKSRNTTS